MKTHSFSTSFLDRVSVQRSNDHWINEQLSAESTLFIPVLDSKVLCTSLHNPRAVYLTKKDIKDLSKAGELSVFLGISDNKAIFAIDVELLKSNSILNTIGDYFDFRQVMSLLSYHEYALLALARFMIHWQSKNRFCGKCASATKSAEAGNSRICQNSDCGERYFPAMDPAIIVLVICGDCCLLGRQKRWPDLMYSTIAGFVEPGERMEDTVVREVHEETGVTVGEIEYQASQSWLMPASLMLGFTAIAKDEKIKFDTNELQDARWFTREEIKDNLQKGLLKMPGKLSIARSLIKEWFDKGDLGKLDEIET
jgi:NAD+ diphosphatase